jgi:hypothetical protein
MEFLLWLALILRLLYRALPYLLGILGALLVVGFGAAYIPTWYVLPLFFAVACGLACGFKNTFPSGRNRPPRYSGRTGYRARNRQWRRFDDMR